MAPGKRTDPSSLIFFPAKNKKDLENIVNFDLEAFSALPDVDWSVKGLQKQMEQDWKPMAVTFQNEIVAAVLVKGDEGKWFTKTSPIKLAFQGNGFSHAIKEKLEMMAQEQGLGEIRHYCPSDNFRLIALNERHGYKKISTFTGKNGVEVQEWGKKITNSPRGK